MRRIFLLGLMIVLLGACSGQNVPVVETSRPTFPAPIAVPAVADAPQTDTPNEAVWSGSANDTTVFCSEDSNAFDGSGILDMVNQLEKEDLDSLKQSISRIREQRGIYVAIVLDKVPAESLKTEYAHNALSASGIGNKPYLLLFILEVEGEMPITGILAEHEEVRPLLSAELELEILRTIANLYPLSASSAIDSALQIAEPALQKKYFSSSF